ncbi:Fanconi anemia core complex-associated protein 100 isoform X2 [Talpa occidentalis]|uniref:Fanconi anemia core complex-associated protein 100 isoform X2 n=1 Tax=Talpa occidentalis TaxID=50954 RepID=UPI00188F3C71|nr:Fanconi anemia core complex-associated protein 100 isoform X2 [Talpa occidentalis]
MARLAPRVEYLAGFRCPLGGLAAGRPRLLCRGADILLSPGGELLHVYDREAGLLTAAYRFPAQVWHLQLLAGHRALLVLCAQRGIYCLSLEQAGRTVHRDGRDSESPAPVVAVEPDACVLADATLCAFAVLDHTLAVLGQGPARWRLQLFHCPCPRGAPSLGGQIGEVELPPQAPPGGSPGQPPAPGFLPVLCCVSPPGQSSGGFTLEEPLFGLLFGADASILQSPVILCGLPDGQLCYVVLKALVTSRLTPGDPKALVKILHHLEEPVVFVGALRTEPQAEDTGDMHSDCLVALGHHGRMLAVKARRDAGGGPVPELRDYCLPGPVLCAASGGSCLYQSTPSGLHVLDLARGGSPQEPTLPTPGRGVLPPMLCPASLSVCSLMSLCVPPGTREDGTELLAMSAKGRLLTCHLAPSPSGAAAASTDRKIAGLLARVAATSERASSLRKALDQRSQALARLNEAMSVSCALLSTRAGPPPISCSTTTAWHRLHPRDVLVATCQLENRSSLCLGPGWALCVRLLPPIPSTGPTLTCTVPLGRFGPGGQREVTLPLGPGKDGALDLPVTVSCTLFYSLREAMGGPPGPQDPPGCPPEQDGVCLPLSEHTVDLLQGLRFPGLAEPPAPVPSLLGPAGDPVDAFLGTCRGPGLEPAGPAPLRATFLLPPAASIRVSAELLGGALGDIGAVAAGRECCRRRRAGPGAVLCPGRGPRRH